MNVSRPSDAEIERELEAGRRIGAILMPLLHSESNIVGMTVAAGVQGAMLERMLREEGVDAASAACRAAITTLVKMADTYGLELAPKV